MKLKLNTWQRMRLTMLLGSLQGNIRLIRKAGKALDVLELTEDEKKEIGYKPRPNGATWSDTERTFEIDIADKEALGLVKKVVKQNNTWEAGNAPLIIDLFEQLNIEEDEDDISQDVPAPPAKG